MTGAEAADLVTTEGRECRQLAEAVTRGAASGGAESAAGWVRWVVGAASVVSVEVAGETPIGFKSGVV